MEWRCIAQAAQQLAIPSVLALFLGGTFCTPVSLITGMSPLEKCDPQLYGNNCFRKDFIQLGNHPIVFTLEDGIEQYCVCQVIHNFWLDRG